MEKPLPDIVAPGLGLTFRGLNPGLSAAAAGHHFVGRGKRFWRVLHLAGFTPRSQSRSCAGRLPSEARPGSSRRSVGDVSYGRLGQSWTSAVNTF